MQNFMITSISLLLVTFIALYLSEVFKRRKYQKKVQDLENKNNELELKTKNYIKSVKEEARRLQDEAQEILENSKVEAEDLLRKAKREAQEKIDEAKIKASEIVSSAKKISDETKELAKEEAEKIAGDALKYKDKAELLEKTARSMRNQISGYGDEYLIPNQSLIDDLADEYDHEKAGQDLKEIKKEISSMIKLGTAATCEYVEEQRKNTAINFALDAFNGKVDTIISKAKHDNFGKLKARLEDAFNLVNYNGSAFRNARITDHYYQKCLKQLELAVMVSELKRRDQEEQRRIKEQIREEEKARREYEAALKEAEKQEKVARKAYEEAKRKYSKANEEEKSKLEQQILELEARVKEAEENGQRALSMAQQTKRGHVYIISNIGSFGEKVFKIGLTRRLEPMDRVRELGDASVPFPFDVHAMIFSEDAPALESELHRVFKSSEVNRINPRKEFFKIDLSEIKNKVSSLGYNCHWTMKAEAEEFRESVQIENKRLLQEQMQKEDAA